MTLTSATRQSGVQQTSTQVTSLSELDNIDVFDFFNCPKVLESVSIASGGHINILPTRSMNELSGDVTRAATTVANLESDWLGFSAPFN